MPEDAEHTRSALTAALDAARGGRKAEFLALTTALGLREADRRPEALWLLAEHAYQRRDFRETLRLFAKLEQHSRAAKLAPWMRYQASHRQCFSHFKSGEYAQAAEALSEAEKRLAASPDLVSRRSDLEALHAHLLERSNNFEGALARFEIAYQQALADRYWARVVTTASDAGRIHGILGHSSQALHWLERARRHARKIPDPLTQRTNSLRVAMIHASLLKGQEALDELARVIDASHDGQTPEVLVDALAQRASLHQLRRSLDASQADRERALAVCQHHGLQDAALYLHKDQAMLYLEIGGADRVARARAEFSVALGLALQNEPPQALPLLQLADDILAEPELIPRRAMAPATRSELRRVVQHLRPLTGSHIYQQATRRREAAKLLQELFDILFAAHEPEIRLASSTIRGRVVVRADGARRIRSSERALLHALLAAGAQGISADDLVRRLHVEYPGVMARITRLRSVLGDDLVGTQAGRKKRYSLRLPDVSPDPRKGTRRPARTR